MTLTVVAFSDLVFVTYMNFAQSKAQQTMSRHSECGSDAIGKGR